MPSRLRKKLERSLMVSWREQPTRYDIEALQANIRRVGLVVRVRWVLIVVLVVYSVLGGLMYATRIPIPDLARLMWVPAVALGLVVLYNAFYSLNYRRLGNIAVWNNLQLGLDSLVVTVLVYFSGGANSWFWSMYSLFILEAAFILPRSRDIWLQSLACVGLLGAIEWLEFANLLPHQAIPFAGGNLHHDLVFVMVRYLWQVAVLLGTAGVATLLVGQFRAELASRASQTLLDNSTGLFSRGYFMRTFPAELRRGLRDGRPVHVLLMDIDNFGEFNRRFGIDAGDRLLVAIAEKLSAIVAPSADIATTNLVARIGGEEFAVLYAEDDNLTGPPTPADALAIAEKIRAGVQSVQVEGAGITMSVGVATLLRDASTADELLEAADTALSCAIEDGGNRVVTAEECGPRSDGDEPAEDDARPDESL